MFEHIPEYCALMNVQLVQSDRNLINEINKILSENEKPLKKNDKNILETPLYQLFVERFSKEELDELDKEIRKLDSRGGRLKQVLIELYKSCVVDCGIKGFLDKPRLNLDEFCGKQLDIRYIKGIGTINATIKKAEGLEHVHGKKLVFHLKNKQIPEVILSYHNSNFYEIEIKRTSFYFFSEYLIKASSDSTTRTSLRFEKSLYTPDLPLQNGYYFIEYEEHKKKSFFNNEYPYILECNLFSGNQKCYTISLSFKKTEDEQELVSISFAQSIKITDYNKTTTSRIIKSNKYSVYEGNLSDLTDSKVYVNTKTVVPLQKGDVESISIRQMPSGEIKEKSGWLRRLEKIKQHILSQFRLEASKSKIEWLLDDLISNGMHSISDSAIDRLSTEAPELSQLLKGLYNVEQILNTGETLPTMLKQLVLDASYEQLMGPQPQGLFVYETMKLLSGALDHIVSIQGRNAVFLLGNTGSGKSTFTNYMLGLPVVARKNNYGMTVVELDNEASLTDGNYAKIGQSMTVSETTYVKGYPLEKEDLVLVDCPGFKDTRSSRYELATLLSIDQGIKAASGVGAIVLVLPYMTFHIDRATLVFELFQDLASRVGGFLEDGQIRQSLFLVVTKALDIPEAEENFSAIIDRFIQEISFELQSLSPSDPSYYDLKKRCDIWQLLGELCAQDRVIFPSIMDKDTFNESDNNYHRNRILEKFKMTPGIPKQKFLPAMDNPRIQQQFGNYISVSIGNWKNLLVKPYIETLPERINEFQKNKTGKYDEIEDLVQVDIRETKRAHGVQQENEELNKKVDDIKNLTNSQQELDKSTATQLLQEINKSRTYFNQQLEKDKQNSLINISRLKAEEIAAQKLLEKEEESINFEKEKAKKLKDEVCELEIEIKRLGEEKIDTVLGKDKHDLNKPLRLRTYEKGELEETFSNFGEDPNKDRNKVYTDHDPKTYKGIITIALRIHSEYRLVGNDVTGSSQINYSENGESTIQWGNSIAIINGNRYKPRPVEIGRRSYIAKASEDGKTVVYCFTLEWKGDGIVPWLEIRHRGEGLFMNAPKIDQKQGEKKAKLEAIATQEENISTAEKKRNDAQKALDAKQIELKQEELRLKEIEIAISNTETQEITSDLKQLEADYRNKIMQKKEEIIMLEKNKEWRKAKRREWYQEILKYDKEIADCQHKKRRYAASIYAQWEVGSLLRTFAEQVTVGGVQNLGIDSSNSNQTDLSKECLDYVQYYDRNIELLKESLKQDLGSVDFSTQKRYVLKSEKNVINSNITVVESTNKFFPTDEASNDFKSQLSLLIEKEDFKFQLSRPGSNEIIIRFTAANQVLMTNEEFKKQLIALTKLLKNDIARLGLDREITVMPSWETMELKITSQRVDSMKRVGALLKDVGMNYWNQQQLHLSQVFFKPENTVNNNQPQQEYISNDNENSINCSIQ